MLGSRIMESNFNDKIFLIYVNVISPKVSHTFITSSIKSDISEDVFMILNFR